jgi:hypothetical protein
MMEKWESKNKFMFLIGTEFHPYSLYLRPIIEKYTNIEAPAFYRLETDALLGRRVGRDFECIFDEDLNSIDKSSQYKLIALFAYFLGTFISLFAVSYIFAISFMKKIMGNKSFFYNFLRVSLNGIVIGDCICSWFLRAYSPNGMLIVNGDLVQVAWRYGSHFYAINIFLTLIKFFYKKTGGYFITQEITYLDELKRRILLKKNYTELRLNYSTGSFLPYEKKSEFHSVAAEEFNAISINNIDYKLADQVLRKFVYREDKYLQLEDCDVSHEVRLDLGGLKNRQLGKNKKTAVIFLHQISDAAYLFGVDCFDDLHHWMIESIRILSTLNFLIIIKIHPAYFSKKLTYPIDIKYAKFLEEIFGVNFNSMSQTKIHSTLFSNVYFVHHAIPALELSRCFPDFLCITHHGTVACEASYLGHTVLVSNASPYCKRNEFVKIYQSTLEYGLLIEAWINGGLKQDDCSKATLLEYFMNRSNPFNMEQKLASFRKFLGFSRESHDDFLYFINHICRGSSDYHKIISYLKKAI